LFLPCAAGVEDLPGRRSARASGLAGDDLRTSARRRAAARVGWREVMKLNLHSRLAQRVLVQLSHAPYRGEDDLYEAAAAVAWEDLVHAARELQDRADGAPEPAEEPELRGAAHQGRVADRFRERGGVRPDVDTQRPDGARLRAPHHRHRTLYIDTSGEPLFKRGWREDKGEAPLKETLAAAMIAASGWDAETGTPLYDPCCGSGTIAIEAAQIACNIAAGLLRRFGFERLRRTAARVAGG
jgi:putative N6-adenine-specific DNA methylase